MNNYLKICLYTVVSSLICVYLCSCGEKKEKKITVNQVGYKTQNKKVAFAANMDAKNFKIRDVESQKIVHKGKIQTNFIVDSQSGDIVHKIDFSNLNRSGVYRVEAENTQVQSVNFKIGKHVFRSPAIKVLESFYLQRCGTAVDNGSKWSHPACHLDDANFYSNPKKTKDVTGGWHDAGDYNKFAITTTLSAGFLLYQYEHNPSAYYDGQLEIPEAGNGIPDILDEIRWGLEWLMRMQRADGAVYFKVSIKKWSGEHFPHKENLDRFIFEVNSNATANLAAVAALGARIYEPYDPAFASQLQSAAEKAWDYISGEPVTVPLGGFHNPPEVKGGEYRDHQDDDERLWASAELYRTTGREEYHRYYLSEYQHMKGPDNPPLSWKNVENMAHYAYLDISKHKTNTETRQKILGNLDEYANKLVGNINENRYNYALRADQYYWGSNSIAMGYAFDLIQAYRFLDEEKYLKKAKDQLHYIMGRNPMQQSYVTNIGQNGVEHPYHQFSMLAHKKDPVPGMLVGGPNNYSTLESSLSRFPAKNYEDDRKNYMVNETAINYTAALSYVIGYFLNSAKHRNAH